MANAFSAVGHFFGKVALAVVSIVHKADAVVAKDAPVVQAVLGQGASVAALIPGIGSEAAAILNAGLQLVGDFKATADGLDTVTSQVVTQLKAMAPTGYSIVLIKQDVEDDLKALLSTWNTEFAAANPTVSLLSAPPSTTVPVALNTAAVMALAASLQSKGDGSLQAASNASVPVKAAAMPELVNAANVASSYPGQK